MGRLCRLFLLRKRPRFPEESYGKGNLRMKKILSLLQVKLPVLHYRLEGPELLQGVLMIAVGLSTVPVLQETLGMSYSAALTAVAIGTGRFIEFAHDMNSSLESSMGPSGGREDY